MTLDVTSDAAPRLNFLLIFPALYVAVAVHELGHLLAGRIVGMKPGGLVIGGFSIVKSGRHHSVRFDYRRIMGGGMAMFLTTKNRVGPNQFAWAVAGGPLASLALTAVFGAVLLLHSDYSGGWTNILFWVSLLGMSSLIPASAGVNKSDGARLWELLRHPDRAVLDCSHRHEQRGKEGRSPARLGCWQPTRPRRNIHIPSC